jgi:hypothetical protein
MMSDQFYNQAEERNREFSTDDLLDVRRVRIGRATGPSARGVAQTLIQCHLLVVKNEKGSLMTKNAETEPRAPATPT